MDLLRSLPPVPDGVGRRAPSSGGSRWRKSAGDVLRDTQELFHFSWGVAVQRRYAHSPLYAKRFKHALGIDAAGDPFVNGNAAATVFEHGLCTIQVLKADGQDQIALAEVGVVQKHRHSGHVAQASCLCAAIEQGREQGSLMQLDMCDACFKERAALGGLAEMGAEPADVVHNLAEHRKLPRGRAAQIPERQRGRKARTARSHGSRRTCRVPD